MKSGDKVVCGSIGITLAVLFGFALAGCGGGGGGGDSTPPATPKNVALAANGGVASATYDNAGAVYVNDADTATNYWSGNIVNDSVIVTFDKTYTISQIRYYTDTYNDGDTVMQYSTDGVNYTNVSYYYTASGVFCSARGNDASIGGTNCLLSAPQQAKYVRIVIAANPATTRIYELEVTGQ